MRQPRTSVRDELGSEWRRDWHLKELLVLAAVVTFLLLLLLPGREVSLGVGHLDVPLEFVVLDAASGRPVAGASLRLEDLDFISSPQHEPESITRTSGPDGHISIKLVGVMFTTSALGTDDGRFTRRLSRSVQYPGWECEISADGYQDLKISNEDVRARYLGQRQFHEDDIPPAMIVRLQKKADPRPAPER